MVIEEEKQVNGMKTFPVMTKKGSSRYRRISEHQTGISEKKYPRYCS
jgi:hypothetical protein